jgi:hypothetical protein
MTNVTAVRAKDFVNTIGANCHCNWRDAGMSWQNDNNISAALAFSGIRHIRDAIPLNGFTMPIYQRLASEGIKFNILCGVTPDFSNSGSWATDLNQIWAFEQSRPGSVMTIEGPNEVNMWEQKYNGQSTKNNLAIGRDIQKKLWDQVKAHPNLRNIPVNCLTVAAPPGSFDQARVLADMSDRTDYGNAHVYYGNGDQAVSSGRYKQFGYDVAKMITSSKSVMITETGYYTAVNDMGWGGGGVSEPVQARLMLNLLFAAAQMGARRNFIYSLMDDRADLNAANTIESSFGIFKGNGQPKQAGTAIHNLTTILTDDAMDATSFAPGQLDYTLTGLPATGQSYLMQKASKNYCLAVWAEPDIWDQPNKRQINVNPTNVTLNLASPAETVKVFDLMIGTNPVANENSVNGVSFGVSDHPVIVEIKASSGSTPPVEPPPSGGGDYDADIEELWKAVDEQEERLTALIEHLHKS